MTLFGVHSTMHLVHPKYHVTTIIYVCVCVCVCVYEVEGEGNCTVHTRHSYNRKKDNIT